MFYDLPVYLFSSEFLETSDMPYTCRCDIKKKQKYLVYPVQYRKKHCFKYLVLLLLLLLLFIYFYWILSYSALQY